MVLVFLKITFSYLEIFLKNVFWIHNLKILFAQSTYFRQKTSSIYVTFYSSGGFIRYHSITFNYIHFFCSTKEIHPGPPRFTAVLEHGQTWWYSVFVRFDTHLRKSQFSESFGLFSIHRESVGPWNQKYCSNFMLECNWFAVRLFKDGGKSKQSWVSRWSR